MIHPVIAAGWLASLAECGAASNASPASQSDVPEATATQPVEQAPARAAATSSPPSAARTTPAAGSGTAALPAVDAGKDQDAAMGRDGGGVQARSPAASASAAPDRDAGGAQAQSHETDAAAAPPTAAAPLTGKYVAMGSSYAAGPSIPDSVPGQACGRSTNNYAHLIATELGLDLVDVSCSGATSDNIALVSQGINALQIQALTADTKLVTITIGGNDIGYASALSACGNAGAAGSSCLGVTVNMANVDAQLAQLDDKLTTMLEAVQKAAPMARVFLVAYPRVLPEPAKACPPDVPMLVSDATFVGQMGERLQKSFVASARAAGVHFVDVYAASSGHDACASKADRWIEGQATAGATAYHPNATGMRAQAKLIIEAINTMP